MANAIAIAIAFAIPKLGPTPLRSVPPTLPLPLQIEFTLRPDSLKATVNQSGRVVIDGDEAGPHLCPETPHPADRDPLTDGRLRDHVDRDRSVEPLVVEQPAVGAFRLEVHEFHVLVRLKVSGVPLVRG